MTVQEPNTILIVDDEEDIRDVLAIALADMGYAVLEAENGKTALALFRENNPGIVLTDIKMPGMDGIEVLKKIKAQNPEVQVIMITGHGDTDIAIRSLKHEAIDFITKPISNEALEIALKRANEKIITRRQLRDYTESLENMVREKTILRDNLTTLGVMIGSVSHSVKGLLTKLDGSVYLIRSALKKEDPDQLKDGMEILETTIDRIKKMIFDILFYSKEREMKVETIDLAPFSHDVADTCEPKAAPHKIEIRRDFSDAPQTFSADPGYLRSALINILDNAIDACIEDTSKPDHTIWLTVRGDKENLVFDIRDNGTGMDREVREKLFNLFFSSKQDKGTGFGLFISQSIVRQHGGVIQVKSAKGKGSCFHVRLPVRTG